MSFLSFGLNQECTHWAVTGTDGYNRPTFSAPRQIKCRWEDRVEKIQNDEGVEVLSRSRIFLEDDLTMGDYLFLGISDNPDPREVPGAYRVMAMRKTPGLFAEDFERKAYL
jgi:hypothetical protein